MRSFLPSVSTGRTAFQILLFLLFPGGGFAQQGTLEVPIRFKIEDGSLNGATISIQKKGGGLQKISGDGKLTLDLVFNEEYTLTFAKEGYVTKRILVNTKVPPDRLKQGFDPYDFDVVLFKQYEGVNIIVFNQPVAKIAFSNEIDDFDYDVDYTKSIQSALEAAETQIKKKQEEELDLMIEIQKKMKKDSE